MIDFRGTVLMPEARGEAKVESKQGVIKIDANMEHMQAATAYGPEYLTYVMWAVTPEGRATNIGEVLLNGGHKSSLHATSELQTFALIITAEPYFAVTQPSDVVVMENIVRNDTTGTIEQVDAKYELLSRGQYTLNVNPSELRPMDLNPKIPLELYEARNAVRIARWTGAERYAAETFHKATENLENAEGYLIGKGGKKPIGTVAREACQMAEDARLITVKKMDEMQLAAERQAGVDRENAANTERVRAESERTRAESERTRAEAERSRAEADKARAERERNQAQADRTAAEQATANANRAKAEADAARAVALQQQQAAQAETDKARLAAEEANRLRGQAEQDRADLRAQLLKQFNLILETRDTARGLIVNMSDVLFDTGKFTLRPAAREKLAKVSGILLSHPGLRIDVEGHTDSVGGEDYNQKLSEERASAVRDYLVAQSIAPASVAARGFGKTQPVASNDSSAGRQQNRRVEMVVSGEIIGVAIGTPQP
jgi:outer membrane protein OmpA-like peptidoglycan-associated protein